MDAKFFEGFRMNAARVGERTAAVVLIEVTKTGKVSYVTGGDDLAVGGLLQYGQAFFARGVPIQGEDVLKGAPAPEAATSGFADLGPPEFVPIPEELPLPEVPAVLAPAPPPFVACDPVDKIQKRKR